MMKRKGVRKIEEERTGKKRRRKRWEEWNDQKWPNNEHRTTK